MVIYLLLDYTPRGFFFIRFGSQRTSCLGLRAFEGLRESGQPSFWALAVGFCLALLLGGEGLKAMKCAFPSLDYQARHVHGKGRQPGFSHVMRFKIRRALCLLASLSNKSWC